MPEQSNKMQVKEPYEYLDPMSLELYRTGQNYVGCLEEMSYSRILLKQVTL